MIWVPVADDTSPHTICPAPYRDQIVVFTLHDGRLIPPRIYDSSTCSAQDLDIALARQRDWGASEVARELVAALGLGALALGALAEALRGGRNGRTALFAALLLQPILLAPVTRQALAPEDAPWMVVQSGGVLARAEPRPDASRQAHFAAGDELAVVDRWPGWLMVEGPEGVGVWVPEGALFALDR